MQQDKQVQQVVRESRGQQDPQDWKDQLDSWVNPDKLVFLDQQVLQDLKEIMVRRVQLETQALMDLQVPQARSAHRVRLARRVKLDHQARREQLAWQVHQAQQEQQDHQGAPAQQEPPDLPARLDQRDLRVYKGQPAQQEPQDLLARPDQRALRATMDLRGLLDFLALREKRVQLEAMVRQDRQGHRVQQELRVSQVQPDQQA